MKGLSISRIHSGSIVRNFGYFHSEVTFLQDNQPPLLLPQSTDFVEFFTPLFPRVDALCWLLEDMVFAFPPEWDGWDEKKREFQPTTAWNAFLGEHLALNGDLRLARPGFLETYAQYFCDDWCEIAGFTPTPKTPIAFLEHYSRHSGTPTEKLRKLSVEVEILFRCIDGVRWELLARDRHLIALIQKHLAHRKDLNIMQITVDDIYP